MDKFLMLGEITGGVDGAVIAGAVKTAFEATLASVTPVAGSIFATILGIKFIPRVIKWFTKG